MVLCRLFKKQKIFDVYKNYKSHLKKRSGLKTNIN